ncbi:MAG: M20/M25/M40 family metallo-hydrolase, partial [Candidatus Competibacterales bacterium]
ALARHRDAWPGELVLTLAGDEEVMGIRGTQYLIDRHSAAKGDGVICADVGGPAHLRLGEKGMIWLAVRAAGKMAHGAHVHRGINAIDRLRQAMDALATLRHYPVTTPKAAADTMARARVQRAGREPPEEATILQTLTVNFGRIEGGETANLVADRATVYVDIRLPLGVSVTQIEGEIHARLGAMEGIDVEVLRRYEPSWTDPADPVVQAVAHASQAVLDAPPLVDMRIGASDARLYRAAGVPTVVCGPTPHNLGAPDEYLIVGELLALAQIYVLAAWQFLNAPD